MGPGEKEPLSIDEVLRRTLDDERLSRGEKQALAALFSEPPGGERERALWRHRAFEIARERLRDPRDRPLLDWLEEVTKLLLPREPKPEPPPIAEACFAPDQDASQVIAQRIARVRRTLEVCVYTLTDDRLAEAILAAHRRGVRVRIISDDEKSLDPGSDADRLQRAGIEVRTDRSPHHMHHKFALFDGALLLTGSYNWTRSAATCNQENFILTSDERLLRAFAAEFERLWERFG